MELLRGLTSNYVLNASLCSWVAAQLIKALITLIMTKKFVWERLFGSGGMPSGHSATVCAMTISMSRVAGVSSPEFALALLFAAVVMHDAMGVRRAAGEQAKVLNAMLDDWDEQFNKKKKDIKNNIANLLTNKNGKDVHGDENKSQENKVSADSADKNISKKGSYKSNNDLDLENVELKEYLGHTPLEVFAGALLGIIIALIIPKT